MSNIEHGKCITYPITWPIIEIKKGENDTTRRVSRDLYLGDVEGHTVHGCFNEKRNVNF